jgi:protein involved in polysaccharide export with SLBB domain
MIQGPHGLFRPRALLPWLLLLALGLGAFGFAACRSSPDKRLLQYLNEEGFGNRYTGNAEEENYLAIGDTLDMTDSYHPTELTLSATVDVDGTVVLPEIGAVHVAGQTRTQLEAFLLEKYSPYYEQLDIKVKLATKGKVFFVFGEVANEGAKPFPGDLTVFEAVMAASPDKQTANLGRVRLIRADPRDPQIIYVNLDEIVEQGDSTFNVHVHERDILYVPPTMLAQFGYFLSDLIFPVTEVLRSLGGALFFFIGGRGVRRRGAGPVF